MIIAKKVVVYTQQENRQGKLINCKHHAGGKLYSTCANTRDGYCCSISSINVERLFHTSPKILQVANFEKDVNINSQSRLIFKL